jgi:ADP-ribosylglycohydrolase
MTRNLDTFAGCLLGGAVGDALGAPIEFRSLAEIRSAFGSAGVTDLIPEAREKVLITDDTQMTMFTAEGLLRAHARFCNRGLCHVPSVVHHAYLRWLHTQGEREVAGGFKDQPDDGWLISVKALHARRSPGNTCLGALGSGEMGTIRKHLNDSKGCGGVMRVAPVGLYMPKKEVFSDACELAAITHGHPSGFLAAGAFALIIHDIVVGISLADSIKDTVKVLKRRKGHEESLDAISCALDAVKTSKPSPETVEKIGKGWVAEESLAIAIYCASVAEVDFRKGLCLAVNHGGDSDSTGSMTGNILGAMLGKQAIPQEWLARLEMASEIEELALDLLSGYEETDKWSKKYPPW